MHLLPWVAIGGALGAVLRFGVGLWAVQSLGPRWPWGTLAVNVLGSLALGVVLEWSARGGLAPGPRALLATGLLGAFTTFSTFSVETVQLLERGDAGAAVLNIGGNVVASLCAAALGIGGLRLAMGTAGQ